MRSHLKIRVDGGAFTSIGAPRAPESWGPQRSINYLINFEFD